MAGKLSVYNPLLRTAVTSKAGENTLVVPYAGGDVQADFDATGGTTVIFKNGGHRFYIEDTNTFSVAFNAGDFTITWLHPTESLGDTDDVTIALNMLSKHALTVAGITLPLAVNQGGTGATDAATAQTNLGGTTLGKALFTAANAAAARTSLGSTAVGDAVFTAANAAAARSAIGAGTGNGDVVSTTTVSAGSGLSGGGDLSANRTISLNLGSANQWTAQQRAAAGTLTDGATVNWDVSSAQVAKVTLAGNRTMAAPTNQVADSFYSLTVIQDATGTRVPSWNSAFKGMTGVTLTTTANAKDELTFRSDGTNMMLVGYRLNVGA